MKSAKRGALIDRAERDDASFAAWLDCVRRVREAQIEAGRLALLLERKGHHVHECCASFSELGARRIGSGSEAAEHVALGRALERWPELAQEVVSGRVSIASAARMGRLARNPLAVREGDDWAGWAAGESERAFARRVNARREEVSTGVKPVVERTFHLTPRGADLLEDARKIASRKVGRVLTEGETVEEIADHYLDCHDPRRVTPGTRRMPDTATIADRRLRKPAAEVVREVRERNGDRCAVDLCPNSIFVDNSHRVAHAEGGAREAKDLDRLCTTHHDLYERGIVCIGGHPDAPRFFTADGRSLDVREGFARSGDPPG